MTSIFPGMATYDTMHLGIRVQPMLLITVDCVHSVGLSVACYWHGQVLPAPSVVRANSPFLCATTVGIACPSMRLAFGGSTGLPVYAAHFPFVLQLSRLSSPHRCGSVSAGTMLSGFARPCPTQHRTLPPPPLLHRLFFSLGSGMHRCEERPCGSRDNDAA